MITANPSGDDAHFSRKREIKTDEESENRKPNQDFIHWGRNALLSLGYTLNSHLPKSVQVTPWSDIVRFHTSKGVIYLKHTPKQLALEAIIIQVLHDQFNASVPKIIAHNSELHCFLMEDAGRPLRGILKQKFDTELLCKAIDKFTSLQLTVSDHVSIFLDLGVPDWRLVKLPLLFEQLLSQKEILLSDGLSEIEVNELKKLIPTVSQLCNKLTEYSIKPSIVQCDFHDNNILISDLSQETTFIDLGEIVISHPFFSLIGCLRQTKKHHGLTDEDESYRQLMKAFFKNFMVFETEKRLVDAFAIAQQLWIIYEALAQYRLMLACDKAKFIAFQRHGKLRDALKEFMWYAQLKAR